VEAVIRKALASKRCDFQPSPFLDVLYHFLENRQDIATALAGNPMGLFNQLIGTLLEIFLRRDRNIQALVLPAEQPHGHLDFLLPQKAHGISSLMSVESVEPVG
jgi:hypothetical protein